MDTRLYFNRTLGATVPDAFYDAAVAVALRRGVTVADLVRSAVSARLTAEGERHPAIPDLKRTTYANTRTIRAA